MTTMTNGLALQREQKLWGNWAYTPPGAAPLLAAGDEELQPILDSVRETLGGDVALLTRLSDNGTEPAQIVARSGGYDLSPRDWQLLSMLPNTPLVHHDWASCSISRKVEQVLRIPLGNRGGGLPLTLSILFEKATPATRETALFSLQRLLPLLEGYFRQSERSRSAANGATALRAALDAVDMGIMLLDRSGKVSFANHTALQLIKDGSYLRCAGDWLSASNLRDAVALQVALQDAIAASAGGSTGARLRRTLVLPLRSAKSSRSVVLSVVPCDEAVTASSGTAAIVLALDPERESDEQLQAVCRVYGLSPVESRLVCLITGGASLQQAAKTMRIKELTARSYLKQVFIKTGAKRQADLVRLMLCSLLRTNANLPVEVVGHR